jgi:hypothetical protein
VDRVDRDGDAIVSRSEFIAGQAVLYWPWARFLLCPRVIEMSLRAAARWRFAARWVRRSPVPTLMQDADDFDDETFMRLMRSRALDRSPQQLLVELFERIGPEPPATPAALDLDVLCLGSTLDRLVPLRTVEAFARRFRRARVVSTEREFGIPSGHAGYFFKMGLKERVLAEVVAHVRRVLA